MPLIMRTQVENLPEGLCGQDACHGVFPPMDWLSQVMKKIKQKKVMVTIFVTCNDIVEGEDGKEFREATVKP
jgi:hypothetical protein